MSVGQFIAGFSECVRQIQKFNNSESLDRESLRKLIDHLLVYLKSFTDDATKCLQTSPLNSRSPSQRSASSSLTSLSPQSPDDDSAMSEEHNVTSFTVSMDECATNNCLSNSRIGCHESGIGLMNGHLGSPYCKDTNTGSVWRPW